jgi:ATP-dependent DNA helicase RecG
LAGIGPKGASALAEAGITTVADLAWTVPVGFDDLRAPLSIAAAIAAGAEEVPPRVCVRAVVKSAGIVPLRGRRAVRVVFADEGKDTLHAWWFFAAHGILALARPGTACLVVGRVRKEPGKPARAAHPDLVRDEPDVRVVRPRYPRLGIGPAATRKAIREAALRLEDAADPVPHEIALRERLPEARAILRAVHLGAPEERDLKAMVERLAWAEAFTRVWERLSAEADGGAGIALPPSLDLAARLRAELGFALTRGQEDAIQAIAADLARKTPMRRLLLGDVGTGKTAVALAAIAQAVGAGAQAALLLPTSVLADQYMDAVAPLARATGAAFALVAAGVPGAARRRALAGLESGGIAVAIGTHALLSPEVRFARLALVVVDEQHRLGVAQRLALGQKSKDIRPHLLTLSATPIPRTLALALRGELATSTLAERPHGRPPVATELRARSEIPSVLEEVRAACARGERVFFVSPRIEVDEDDDEVDPSAGAVARAEALRAAIPHRVALVHGGLGAEEKRQAMRAFRSGAASVLVGTTVIEVGVDVPEATLMVIDQAERFGLAQLHQMRGRVGRGERAGRCILLHDEPLPELAARRLRAVASLTDGAAVARADLALRGAGDLSGTRQHGLEEELLFLDPARPPEWLARLEADARAVFAQDRGLAHPEHAGLALAVRRLRRAIAVRDEAG